MNNIITFKLLKQHHIHKEIIKEKLFTSKTITEALKKLKLIKKK